MPSINATAFFGWISRTCKLARVVTWQTGLHSFSIQIGQAGELPVLQNPVGIL